MYAKYNRMYFANKLPDDVAVWWEPPDGAYADCNKVDNKFRIRISPAISGWTEVWKLALLHEMSHVCLWPLKKHTKKFQSEMLRLASLGAFNSLW